MGYGMALREGVTVASMIFNKQKSLLAVGLRESIF